MCSSPIIVTALFNGELNNICRENDAHAADTQAYEIDAAVYGSTSPRIFVSWYKTAWWSWREGEVERVRQTAEYLYRELELAKATAPGRSTCWRIFTVHRGGGGS